MYSLFKETGTWVWAVVDQFELKDLGDLTVASMARAAVGRPKIMGGKTPMRINPPILDCDTKKHEDTKKIVEFMELLEQRGDGEEILLILGLGDGQSMIGLMRLKRMFPERYRHVAIVAGNFHCFGHFMFGGQQTFHDPFTAHMAHLLQKEKVPKHIPDFSVTALELTTAPSHV